MRKSGEEICFICGKSPEDFINSRSYFKHFKTKSHAKESYDCDQCQKKFVRNEALKAPKVECIRIMFFNVLNVARISIQKSI